MGIFRYPPVGRCIYCGTERHSESSTKKLATEHIIPLALDGPLELPEASCRACERITGKTEQTALRGLYRAMRKRFDFPHRHTKEQPRELPIFVDVPGGKDQRVMIPLEEYPDLNLFVYLRKPGRLSGVPAESKYGPEHRYLRLAARNVPAPWKGPSSFNTPSLDLFSFCRMLAKTAHSYAVAETGLGSFNPSLLDVILRGSEDIFHFVGCVRPAPVELRSLNRDNAISIDRAVTATTTFLVVHLKLFARSQVAPIYQIVVGEV